MLTNRQHPKGSPRGTALIRREEVCVTFKTKIHTITEYQGEAGTNNTQRERERGTTGRNKDKQGIRNKQRAHHNINPTTMSA